jgi:hypothetical protein
MGKEKFKLTFRFSPCDKVWFMESNRINCDYISRLEKCQFDHGNKSYRATWTLSNGAEVIDERLFSSKIELINHLTGAEL